MSGKAATYLCSTSIVHHRCPTVMAGISSAVGSCAQDIQLRHPRLAHNLQMALEGLAKR
jgi:hypothetical protein